MTGANLYYFLLGGAVVLTLYWMGLNISRSVKTPQALDEVSYDALQDLWDMGEEEEELPWDEIDKFRDDLNAGRTQILLIEAAVAILDGLLLFVPLILIFFGQFWLSVIAFVAMWFLTLYSSEIKYRSQFEEEDPPNTWLLRLLVIARYCMHQAPYIYIVILMWR